MTDDRQQEILLMLHRQELLLAELYHLFSDRFPELADFWEGLSKEEKTHATWIQQLMEADRKGIVGFRNDKLNPKALKTYIAHLENAVEKARKGDFSAKSAMAYTMDFERSLVEKNAFLGFKGLVKKADDVLERLHQETLRHAQKAAAMMHQV